jgi:hypothetical protein
MSRNRLKDFVIFIAYEAAAFALFRKGLSNQGATAADWTKEAGRTFFVASSCGAMAYGSYLLAAKGWGMGNEVNSFAVRYWTASGSLLTAYTLAGLSLTLGKYFVFLGHASIVIILISQVLLTLLGALSIFALPTLFLIDVLAPNRSRDRACWGMLSLLVCLLFYWGITLVCGLPLPWWWSWWERKM